MATPSLLFTDLEGPLTPSDNAYELMRLYSDGGHVFQIVSRYDDLLTLEGRPGYEPGTTLALIVPFLLAHGIVEQDMVRDAERAPLVTGTRELVADLTTSGWQVFAVSTSYEPYARVIAGRVGIPFSHLASTRIPLERYYRFLNAGSKELVLAVEAAIKGLQPIIDDVRIKERLDFFYQKECPQTQLSMMMGGVRPVGGNRKILAVETFAKAWQQSLAAVAVVGDSITDMRMLEVVHAAGGLAVAFNANEYALPKATMGLASASLYSLKPVLLAWQAGGRDEVRRVVQEQAHEVLPSDAGLLHWVEPQTLDTALKVHRRMRNRIRGEAAKLG